MILDAETLALTPGVEVLVAWAEEHDLPGVLKMELLASMVELATDVCSSAEEALGVLTELRLGAAEAAGENGLAIAAAGTHAFSTPTAQQIATRAYFIYESEGGGDRVDHWLRAERELTAR